ncbi:MAG: ParB/RepB/Spo0J family partition protein [Ruminococcus sp.]|nr:ParB/RepB/Spo0J family partition protein [Ruminococcus sp.]
MAKKIGGLGKGLSAIFSENDTEDKNEVVSLKISQIEPNRNQPRRSFDEDALGELAQSIKEHGVLQPILVRPLIYGGYQIVAGERRYRAARLAGLTEIPSIVRELSDSETMQIALIENLQRRDLTALEEAKGYQTLMEEYGFSQEEVARTVGKSRSAVANTLRLLGLPDEAKELLEQGKISAGHARALLSADHDDTIREVAEKVVKEGLSVRETEKLVKKMSYAEPEKKKTVYKKIPVFTEVELALSEHMGTKVHITQNKDSMGGTLCIEFYDPAELFVFANKIEKLWNTPLFNAEDEND